MGQVGNMGNVGNSSDKRYLRWILEKKEKLFFLKFTMNQQEPKKPKAIPFKVDPPEELHKDFKMLCVEAGTNMKARALKLIEEDVVYFRLTGKVRNLEISAPKMSIAEIVRNNYKQLEGKVKNIEAITRGEKPSLADLLCIAETLNLDEQELIKLHVQEFNN